MKFQNPSMHGSEVMPCIKKHNGRTHARMHKCPRSNTSLQLLLSWGHNDETDLQCQCDVRLQDIVTTRSNELLVLLRIEDLNLILKEKRHRWYGHVECSNCAVDTGRGKAWAWGPKMTWKQLTERDCKKWLSTLMTDIPGDLVCHACSKLAIWKGAHWCECCPCTCTLIN